VEFVHRGPELPREQGRLQLNIRQAPDCEAGRRAERTASGRAPGHGQGEQGRPTGEAKTKGAAGLRFIRERLAVASGALCWPGRVTRATCPPPVLRSLAKEGSLREAGSCPLGARQATWARCPCHLRHHQSGTGHVI